MPINRTKLAIIAWPALFFGGAFLSGSALPDIAQEYQFARLDAAAEAYAKSQGTTRFILENRIQSACLARQNQCISDVMKNGEVDSTTGIIQPTTSVAADIKCRCFRPLLALPEETLESRIAGLVGVASSLSSLVVIAVVSLVASLLGFQAIPWMCVRVWRWLHI